MQRWKSEVDGSFRGFALRNVRNATGSSHEHVQSARRRTTGGESNPCRKRVFGPHRAFAGNKSKSNRESPRCMDLRRVRELWRDRGKIESFGIASTMLRPRGGPRYLRWMCRTTAWGSSADFPGFFFQKIFEAPPGGGQKSGALGPVTASVSRADFFSRSRTFGCDAGSQAVQRAGVAEPIASRIKDLRPAPVRIPRGPRRKRPICFLHHRSASRASEKSPRNSPPGGGSA